MMGCGCWRPENDVGYLLYVTSLLKKLGSFWRQTASPGAKATGVSNGWSVSDLYTAEEPHFCPPMKKRYGMIWLRFAAFRKPCFWGPLMATSCCASVMSALGGLFRLQKGVVVIEGGTCDVPRGGLNRSMGLTELCVILSPRFK